LLDDLMNNIPDAIHFKDRELRFQRVNRACAEWMRIGDASKSVGRRLTELGVPPEIAALLEGPETQVLTDGRALGDQVRGHETAEGRRFYSTTLAPIHGPSSQVHGLVGIARDVTARLETEHALRRLTRVRTVLGAVNAAVVRARNRDSLMRQVCRIAVEEGELLAAALLLVDAGASKVTSAVSHGVAGEALMTLGMSESAPAVAEAWNVFHVLSSGRPATVNRLAQQSESPFFAELLRLGAGSLGVFPLVTTSTVVGVFALVAPQPDFFDSEEVRLLSELADNIVFAFDHVEKSARLDFLAYYDELTGLPKRSLLLDRLGQLLPARREAGGTSALLLIDVSRFRHVNETLGRSGGDALLVQVGERLSALCGERDTLARFDSNAFALVLTEPGDESELATFIEKRIFDALHRPFVIGGTELRIASRVGVALFPSDAAEADGLVRNAEAALANTRAKAQPYLFYAPSMNARLGERLTLETRLRRALEEEQFLLYYQPKVELKTGTVVGLEALIRWNDPERGLVPPGQFIPVLEETGLILDVGTWVLARAAAQYAEWAAQELSPPRIAVNVSALQLSQRRFVQSVEHVFERHPTARARLDLEITESVLMEDLGGNIDKLQALKDQGVCIAIDDFGTGYSSLGYLSRLPIDALKIDRSFVIRMSDDAQDMTIVTTIISLAHSLDLKVIAEGVETADQARLLKLVKCDQIQGYLIGRPEAASVAAAGFSSKKRTWPPGTGGTAR
jgi:diguanylate cyclase (GGDEF)-like protein/PAS domain S-box-containing protein